MNSYTSIALVVVIVLLGGWFVLQPSDDAAMQQSEEVMTEKTGDTSMQKDEGAMMEKGDTMMQKDEMSMSAGSYEAYAPERLSKAATGDVVLFFRASWCPTCKTVDADIRANLGKIPADLTILDVNYDTATDLKKKYGVTYQHTFVQVKADGTQIKKWSGSSSLLAIVAEVQ